MLRGWDYKENISLQTSRLINSFISMPSLFGTACRNGIWPIIFGLLEMASFSLYILKLKCPMHLDFTEDINRTVVEKDASRFSLSLLYKSKVDVALQSAYT